MPILSYLLGSLAGVNPRDTKTTTAPTRASSTPIGGPTSPSTTPTSTSPSSGPPGATQQDPPPPSQPLNLRDHYLSRRSLRQFTLFAAGTTFFYLSVLISRRAVARHKLAARLKFYEPNHQSTFHSLAALGKEPPPLKKDPLVAFEALNLATLNTMAFAVMAAGGVSWGLDIADLEDLRRYARRTVVQVGEGERDEEAEREVAEWVARTFGIEERKKGEESGEGEGENGGGDGGSGKGGLEEGK
ncbi:hypothetical protein B0J18DRAFT_488089 [Chaetomium sp. MPI-SDFR-AT-0129]|nr:hypothetical protein B0J18DRAFT_488089 [Chaetomium sp. MPI-SDFR-AT-0129]